MPPGRAVAEHLTLNPKIEGSYPATCTRKEIIEKVLVLLHG
jgi:hypothetical protein